MKNLFAVLLATILVLGFVACSPDDKTISDVNINEPYSENNYQRNRAECGRDKIIGM